ncbi:MAG: biotin/lipoyl-binding protein [Patescibacteria group bacterium]
MTFKNIKILFKYLFIFVVVISIGYFRLSKANTARNDYYQIEGHLEYDEVLIGTYVSGTVKEVLVDKGDYIEKGDLLMKLENDVLVEKVSGMDPSSPYFNEPEFRELYKKIQYLDVYAPQSGYIIELNYEKNSFVRENEILAILAPQDSFKYAGKIDYGTKYGSGVELRDAIVKGTPVQIKFEGSTDKVSSKVVDVTPVTDDLGTNLGADLILLEQSTNGTLILGKKFDILIAKKNPTQKLTDAAKEFFEPAYVSGYVKN